MTTYVHLQHLQVSSQTVKFSSWFTLYPGLILNGPASKIFVHVVYLYETYANKIYDYQI